MFSLVMGYSLFPPIELYEYARSESNKVRTVDRLGLALIVKACFRELRMVLQTIILDIDLLILKQSCYTRKCGLEMTYGRPRGLIRRGANYLIKLPMNGKL